MADVPPFEIGAARMIADHEETIAQEADA